MTAESVDGLIEKLRRNPGGVMFELEHQCADALSRLQRELQEQQRVVEGMRKDAFEAGYIQGHEATVEGRYNLEGATMDFLTDAEIKEKQ